MKSIQTIADALERVLKSKALMEAPFYNYSEAISDAQDILKTYRSYPDSFQGTPENHDKVLRAAKRLAMRCNRVTAEWRHMRTVGKTFGVEEMGSLYDAQIAVEKMTGQVPSLDPSMKIEPDVMKIAFQRVADWLETTEIDNDPEAREFYAKAIREKVEKEFE